MQSQEGMSKPPAHALPSEQTLNHDLREQRQIPPLQEYTERSYEDGYVGLDADDMWSGGGEKLRPRSVERHSPSSLLLILVILCACIIAATFFGLLLPWLSWLLLTVLITGGIIIAISNWRTVTIPMPLQTFSVTEHPQLIINDTVGTISLHRGENGVIQVAPRKLVSGIGVTPENMQVHSNLQNNMLHVSTQVKWNLFQFGLRKIDLDITVPENCAIQVTNGAGRINADGLIGEIQLRTGSGRIETHSLQGKIVLETGSGSISGSDMDGQIVLKTGSGRIDIQRTNMNGSSSFKTGSGSITFDGAIDPYGNYDLRTGSGPVRLSLTSDAAFVLQAKTGSGRVTNEFYGFNTSNGPQARLNIKTGSGSIHIYKI